MEYSNSIAYQGWSILIPYSPPIQTRDGKLFPTTAKKVVDILLPGLRQMYMVFRTSLLVVGSRIHVFREKSRKMWYVFALKIPYKFINILYKIVTHTLCESVTTFFLCSKFIITHITLVTRIHFPLKITPVQLSSRQRKRFLLTLKLYITDDFANSVRFDLQSTVHRSRLCRAPCVF